MTQLLIEYKPNDMEVKTLPKRDKKGHWLKGSVPNPKGRPRKDKSLVEYGLETIGQRGEGIVDFLYSVMHNSLEDGRDVSVSQSMEAVKELTDRLFGKVQKNVKIDQNVSVQTMLGDAFKTISERRGKVAAQVEVNEDGNVVAKSGVVLDI